MLHVIRFRPIILIIPVLSSNKQISSSVLINFQEFIDTGTKFTFELTWSLLTLITKLSNVNLALTTKSREFIDRLVQQQAPHVTYNNREYDYHSTLDWQICLYALSLEILLNESPWDPFFYPIHNNKAVLQLTRHDVK